MYTTVFQVSYYFIVAYTINFNFRFCEEEQPRPLKTPFAQSLTTKKVKCMKMYLYIYYNDNKIFEKMLKL